MDLEFFKPHVFSAMEFMRAVKGRMMIKGDGEGFVHLAESNLGFVFGPVCLTCDVSRHIWLAFRRNANASSINLVSCNGLSLFVPKEGHQGLVGQQREDDLSLSFCSRMAEKPESHRKGCQELEEAAQGSCEATTPGSAQKICGRGIWWHGLAMDLAVLG